MTYSGGADGKYRDILRVCLTFVIIEYNANRRVRPDQFNAYEYAYSTVLLANRICAAGVYS